MGGSIGDLMMEMLCYTIFISVTAAILLGFGVGLLVGSLFF